MLFRSVNAMACRRTRIKSVTVTQKVTTKITTEKNVVPPEKETVNDVQTKPTTIDYVPKKPEPKVEVKTEIKKGIGKKILRKLLSECDYFDVLKQDSPFVYDSIVQKIKYFNPAFHSMTPEGLNSRLTFLNQCVRPGETIPVIGPDGRPKFNDALNTSFGTPPVLVLRIGDFYQIGRAHV